MTDKTPIDSLKIEIGKNDHVSGLLSMPRKAEACFVFAHGAGVGMSHRFMTAVADGLAQRRIGTLRYQFPYMERGTNRPDPPPIAHTAVRAAIGEAARRARGLPLFAGGRSFGGRMTSQAQAAEPLAGVRGLIFFGFPLHPAGKPSDERAAHLMDVRIPMLFLQGTRDSLAEVSLLSPLIKRIGSHADLRLFQDADHSFHVPARTGQTDAKVLADMLDAVAGWVSRTLSSAGPGA